ncbi:MAG: MFS transporter [Xanthomonadales bacterium]|nr:MFS transporter [Xanthomonadales bacterium]
MIRPLFSLLLGVSLLLMGSGLLGTLIAVRGTSEGFSAAALGFMMSAYFCGFFLGTYAGPPLIRRLGHVRAFAFFAAAAAATALLHAMLVNPWAWGVLRLLIGMALVGLYTVIESWMNAQAPNERRGQVFATYMVINLLSLAMGQQLLRLAAPQGFELFSLVALLTCLALMPVTWTRLPQPALPERAPFGVRRLLQAAPTAAVGALMSGLAMGAFWGLAPVFAARNGLAPASVATFMSVAIVGGAVMQWPIGHWSDRRDRRRVLVMVCAGASAAAALLLLGHGWSGMLFAGVFLYGGLAFAVYPLVVAHLMDRLEPHVMLGGSAALLMVNGLGAAIGPALAGMLMESLGSASLLAYLALVQGSLAAYTAWRLTRRSSQVVAPAHFLPMLRTTPAVMELLPEADSPHPSASPSDAIDTQSS